MEELNLQPGDQVIRVSGYYGDSMTYVRVDKVSRNRIIVVFKYTNEKYYMDGRSVYEDSRTHLVPATLENIEKMAVLERRRVLKNLDYINASDDLINKLYAAYGAWEGEQA